MSQESRRKLLKGLAVTLPAAWTTPMVESIVLPAHAETSPGGCNAPAGCYAFEEGGSMDPFSFEWPGGLGPEEIDIFAGRVCGGGEEEPVSGTTAVVAESPEAAQAELSCSIGEVFEIETDPPLDNGCNFYLCPFPL